MKLPSIKLKNRHAVKDLLINEDEAERLNKSIEVSGPTPGIYSLAAARRNLKPDFSFKRVGIKSSVFSPKRLLLNQTIDSSDGFLEKQEKRAQLQDND